MYSDFFSSISTLKKSEKEKLCGAEIIVFSESMRYSQPPSSVHSTQGFPLTSPNQMSKMLNSVIYPQRFKKLREFPQNLPDKSRDYVEISVNIENKTMMVDALPCRSYENHTWYIVGGYAHDIYFAVETDKENGSCILTGILEPAPKVINYCCDPQRKMEEKFFMGQRNVSEYPSSSSDVCVFRSTQIILFSFNSLQYQLENVQVFANWMPLINYDCVPQFLWLGLTSKVLLEVFGIQ